MGNLTAGVLKTSQTLLDKYWNVFFENCNKIQVKTSDPDAIAYLLENPYVDVETDYSLAQGYIYDALDALKPTPGPANAQIRPDPVINDQIINHKV